MDRRGFLVAAAAAAGGAALPSGLASIADAAVNERGLRTEGEKFVLDGSPWQIISGSMHYFRIHPAQWRDRLLRLKAMGLNTVTSYVAWNFHETQRGEFDFDGWRDLEAFVETADQVGLKVILRISPYICAEWEFGGLPAWLLADRELRLRCSEPRYLRAVDDWYDQLIPRLLRHEATAGDGPIIAMQIENEYGSYGNDTAYLGHLRTGIRRRGVGSLLFTADGASPFYFRFGSLTDTLETGTTGGDLADGVRALREFQPGQPAFISEYWAGWFDHWGEPHQTRDPQSAARELQEVLAAGASVNLYMACGSTNFAMSGANTSGNTYQPTVTSYDYDAAISEGGELTEKYHAIRKVLAPYNEKPLPTPPAKPATQTPRTLRATAHASLLDSLSTLSSPVHSAATVSMESIGQNYGLTLYRTTVQGPHQGGELSIHGLGDRAHVIVAGKQLGVLDRNKPDATVPITLPDHSNEIDILVDAMGRVNYGPQLADRKGIDGWVGINGQQMFFGWDIHPLPLNDLSRLRFGSQTVTGPSFHRFIARIDAAEDAYLQLPGWDKGMVWLNGFNLGRYWHIGPQKALYAPAPLWRAGRNELIVLALGATGETVDITDSPDLG